MEKRSASVTVTLHSPEDEIAFIRELAASVKTLAETPRMQKIKQRWRDVTEMRKTDRPPVWCNPVGCWNELLPEDRIACKRPECRELELFFRKQLIKNEIGDDTIIHPFYEISPVFDVMPENRWGIDIRREMLDETGSAWRYLPSLITESDFDRLQIPVYRYNPEKTREKLELYRNILGENFKVRINPLGSYFSVATICLEAAMLRGLEPMMMDMILQPKLVHRLMKVIHDGVMNQLDAIEASGLLFPNIDSAMLSSDPLRVNHSGKFTLADCWIHGNSQELDQVSPEMFEEFLLNYQKNIFARFGAVCYGCCENLTKKLDMVLRIPNLKLLTCSAWTDMQTLVDKAGKRCCIMWRHKASDVVCPDDLAGFKKKIEEQIRILNGCSYQVVLRELQTLMGHENRLREWTGVCLEALS